MVEAAGEEPPKIDERYLEERADLSEEKIPKARSYVPDHWLRNPADAVRSSFKNKGVQPCSDRHRVPLPSPWIFPGSGADMDDDSKAGRQASDSEKFSALAFKADDRPIRWSPDLRACLLRCPHSGATVLTNSVKGRKRSVSVVFSRCTPTTVRKSRKFSR